MFGFIREARNKLSVISHGSSSLSHSAAGKLGSTEHSPAMKCALNVCIVCSAALRRWRCGGTSWKMMLYFLSAYFIILDASLSKIWILGVKPDLERVSIMLIVVFLISNACQVLRGIVRIALLS